jgi:hypothetical protein
MRTASFAVTVLCLALLVLQSGALAQDPDCNYSMMNVNSSQYCTTVTPCEGLGVGGTCQTGNYDIMSYAKSCTSTNSSLSYCEKSTLPKGTKCCDVYLCIYDIATGKCTKGPFNNTATFGPADYATGRQCNQPRPPKLPS